MANDINLLQHKKKSILTQEQVLAYTKLVAVISCILTVSFALVLFLLNRDPSLAQIHAEQQTVLTQLNLLHNKTAKDLIILDRVKRITKILQTRSPLDTRITEFQKQIPNGVTVNSFVLDNKTLNMTVSSGSLAYLGTLIDNLTKDVFNKTLIKKTTIEGIISDEKSGTYLLSITCDLL